MDKHIKFQHFILTQTDRAMIKHQTPNTKHQTPNTKHQTLIRLWMTGFLGAGKPTLANALEL